MYVLCVGCGPLEAHAMSKALALRSELGEKGIIDIIEWHLRMCLLKDRAGANQSLLLSALQECIRATPSCVNHPVDGSTFAWDWWAICGK